MKISGNNPAFVVNIRRPEAASPAAAAGKSQNVAATTATSKTAATDKVVLSAKSREIDKLKQAMDQLPDVRPDKVALAKQKMQSGYYQGSSGSVAQSLLDSLKRG